MVSGWIRAFIRNCIDKLTSVVVLIDFTQLVCTVPCPTNTCNLLMFLIVQYLSCVLHSTLLHIIFGILSISKSNLNTCQAKYEQEQHPLNLSLSHSILENWHEKFWLQKRVFFLAPQNERVSGQNLCQIASEHPDIFKIFKTFACSGIIRVKLILLMILSYKTEDSEQFPLPCNIL